MLDGSDDGNSDGSVERLLRNHILDELAPSPNIKLDLDGSLVGVVDSTGVLELITWIESSFGFTVELEDVNAEDFGTIRRLAAWIRRGIERSTP